MSDLTPKPAKDSDWRPNPKDSVKSILVATLLNAISIEYIFRSIGVDYLAVIRLNFKTVLMKYPVVAFD